MNRIIYCLAAILVLASAPQAFGSNINFNYNGPFGIPTTPFITVNNGSYTSSSGLTVSNLPNGFSVNGGFLITANSTNPLSISISVDEYLRSTPDNGTNYPGTPAGPYHLLAGVEGYFAFSTNLSPHTVILTHFTNDSNVTAVNNFNVQTALTIQSNVATSFLAEAIAGAPANSSPPQQVVPVLSDLSSDNVVQNGLAETGSASSTFNYNGNPIDLHSQTTITFTGLLNGDVVAFYLPDPTELTSAPEPGSLTLLAIGIAAMGGYGWRRKKQLRVA